VAIAVSPLDEQKQGDVFILNVPPDQDLQEKFGDKNINLVAAATLSGRSHTHRHRSSRLRR